MDTKLLKELISSPLFNVTDVVRYSGVHQSEEENVGTHTLRVQLLGSLIIKDSRVRFGRDVFDEGKFLKKALYHDLEEVFTGDIIRPTKYYKKVIKESIDQYGHELMKEVLDDEVNLDCWVNAKEGPEGVLLKVVDLLSCVHKVYTEVEILNNGVFLYKLDEIGNSVRGSIDLVKSSGCLEDEVIRYLVELMNQGVSLINEVKISHHQWYTRVTGKAVEVSVDE